MDNSIVAVYQLVSIRLQMDVNDVSRYLPLDLSINCRLTENKSNLFLKMIASNNNKVFLTKNYLFPYKLILSIVIVI